MKIFILLISLFIAAPALAEQKLFNVLSQDSNQVKEVRAEGNDIWIKLAQDSLSDEIIVRISNKNKDFYRPWFNDNIDLVSTGFRGKGVWSDRVQTSAQYVEYWHNGTLILHLERK